MQKGTKWLIGLVAALVVINIALVATIWLKKEKTETVSPQVRGDARDYLVKTLTLDAAQINSFDSLRRGHFERMDDYRNKMFFVKDRLFHLLQEKDSNIIKIQLATYLRQKIGEVQADIDVETFEHFRQLRNLLYGGQQEKFDSVIQDVLRSMGPKGPPPGEHNDASRPPPHPEHPDGKPNHLNPPE